MSRRSWLLFAAMCVLWGMPYLLIRVAVRDLTPGTLVCVRTGLGGLVLVPFALRDGGFGPVVRHWRPLVLFTGLEIAVPFVLLGDAEQHLSSSLTGLLVAAVPLVGFGVAYLTGSDDRGGGAFRWVGLVLGLVGVVVLLGLDLGQVRVSALVELLVVVVCYATGPVVMARRLSQLSGIAVVSSALLLTAVVYLPYALANVPAHVGAKAIWSVVGLATVCTALSFVLFFALVADIGPSRSTVITYVNPAVALLLGVLLLDEPVTAGILVGFPLILLGSVLAARRAEPVAVADAPVADAAAVGAALAVETAAGQSMRTSPPGVENVAATTPVSPSDGGTQSTSSPSSG